MITVIVLLILAGVTVATLTGENGLLSKAQLAKEKNLEAEQDEKDRLSSYEDELDKYGAWERTGGEGTVTISTEEYTRLLNSSNANNYSTSEQVVGTWTDGRPVYQKTFTGTGTSTGSTYYIVGQTTTLLPDIEKVVNSSAYASFGGYLDYNTRLSIDIATGSNLLSIGQSIGSTSNEFDYIITIQYIKKQMQQ